VQTVQIVQNRKISDLCTGLSERKLNPNKLDKHIQENFEVIFCTRVHQYTINSDRWLSSRFEMFRRLNNLSFSHHEEVADLDPDEYDFLESKLRLIASYMYETLISKTMSYRVLILTHVLWVSIYGIHFNYLHFLPGMADM